MSNANTVANSSTKPLNSGSTTPPPTASGISADDGSTRSVESSPQSGGVDPRAAGAKPVQGVDANRPLDESIVETPGEKSETGETGEWWIVSKFRSLLPNAVSSTPKKGPANAPASIASPTALALSDAEEGKIDQNTASETPSDRAGSLPDADLTNTRTDLPEAIAKVAAMNMQSPDSGVGASSLSSSASKAAEVGANFDKGDKKDMLPPTVAPNEQVATTWSKMPKVLSVMMYIAVIIFAFSMHIVFKNRAELAPHSK